MFFFQALHCVANKTLPPFEETSYLTKGLEHDAEKLHDFSDHIMRPNKGLERSGDPNLSHFALKRSGRETRGLSISHPKARR